MRKSSCPLLLLLRLVPGSSEVCVALRVRDALVEGRSTAIAVHVSISDGSLVDRSVSIERSAFRREAPGRRAARDQRRGRRGKRVRVAQLMCSLVALMRPRFLLPFVMAVTLTVQAVLGAYAAAAIPAWTTYRHDAARSGIDPDSASPVTPSQAWQTPALDGEVYGQPLVYGSYVYVATENDSVYKLDAATGAVVWSEHLGRRSPRRRHRAATSRPRSASRARRSSTPPQIASMSSARCRLRGPFITSCSRST